MTILRPPLPVTSLIGRDEEIAALRLGMLSATTRLITVTGPPGVGKTALALHLAHELADRFEDGAIFVPLDLIREADQVPAAIARALALRETPDRTVAESVQDHLAARHVLLVLDNFEHVIDAAPFVADLLTSCTDLVVLVTSRAPLRIRAEQQFPLEPLPTGDSGGNGADATASPAVALFFARARAVRPSFALDSANAADVAAICAALDGLPLALELAAARVALIPPREIAGRLTHRLALLTGGYRDLPTRQQSLRAAIAWSYDLLSQEDRLLFRRLGIFLGGCTVEAVDAIAVMGIDPPPPALRGLASLVETSLLGRDERTGGEPRFAMLETIREFALEQLTIERELGDLQSLHAIYCLNLAEVAATSFGGPDQSARAIQVQAEYGNLRAALSWTLAGGDLDIGLRLAAALGWFWRMQGSWTDGQDWLDRALALSRGASSSLRTRLLWEAGALAVARGDLAGAETRLAESLDLAREIRDARSVAKALLGLGDVAHFRGDIPAAEALHRQALDVARRAGDQWSLSQTLGRLMIATKLREGDLAEAQRLGEEGLAVARAAGDRATAAWLCFRLGWLAMARGEIEPGRRWFEASLRDYDQVDDRLGVPDALMGLGELARMEGDYALAGTLYADALLRYRQSGDQREIAVAALINLGFVALHHGDTQAAMAHFRQGLVQVRGRGHWAWVTLVLTGLGGVAACAEEPERALCILAAANALRPAGSILDAADQREYERYLAAARVLLDEGAIERAWAAGQAMPLEEALIFAQSTPLREPLDAPPPAPVAVPVATEPEPASASPRRDLTARELDVLRQIAAGQSNSQIAAKLVVSRRTVEHHLANMYAKIGARGRVDAAAYALRHGLVDEARDNGQ